MWNVSNCSARGAVGAHALPTVHVVCCDRLPLKTFGCTMPMLHNCVRKLLKLVDKSEIET